MNNPLEHPSQLSDNARRFLHRHRLGSTAQSVDELSAVATAFTSIPYENLTKIIKHDATGVAEQSRRSADELFGDHLTDGTGGTCFALTAAFLHLLRAFGWQAEPILADRSYGQDTHSALIIWIDGQPHLLDPGYLILKPITLNQTGEMRLANGFNELVLQFEECRIALSTQRNGQEKYRLTYKTNPVDAGQFLKAWDNSFKSDLLRYPVLSQIDGQSQIYFQEAMLQTRDAEQSRRVAISENQVAETISTTFSIAPAIVHRALEILHRKGEDIGQPRTG